MRLGIQAIKCVLNCHNLSLPAPPRENTTTCQDQARHTGANNGARNGSELAADFATWEIRSVDVKIGHPALDARNERRLGRGKRSLRGDERWIVNQRLREIEDWGDVTTGGPRLREPGKHRCCGGDTGVGADGAQQWMCAPVIVGEVKPLKVALICIVWAVGSSTTVARPVPGEVSS